MYKRQDEILYDLRQVIFVGQFESVLDMADNNRRALFVTDAVVRIEVILVFRKVGRTVHLSDVVV